jgi:hypothetical protein
MNKTMERLEPGRPVEQGLRGELGEHYEEVLLGP